MTVGANGDRAAPAGILVERLAHLVDGEDWLGAVVARGDAAVPALEALLRAPPDAVFEHRLRAATALAMIGTAAAVAALERGLRDSAARALPPVHEHAEAAVVSHTARALARAAGPAAAPVLLSVLARRCDPGCAEALGALGEVHAIPRLIECLEDGYAQSPCLRALARFGAGAGRTLADYVAAASENDGALRTGARAMALRLLFDLDPTLAVPLARRLRGPAPELRLAAAVGLARCGAPGRSADELVAQLAGAPAGREAEIADALAACGVRGRRAVPCAARARVLAASLPRRLGAGSPSGNTRQPAAARVGRTPAARSGAGGAACARRPAHASAGAGVAVSVQFFCPQCWAEVAEQDTRCPACGADLSRRLPYREALQRALRHPEPQTARRAAYLLGRLGQRVAVPALVSALDSDDPYVAGEAAAALAKIGGARATAALRAARDHRHATVRREARRALAGSTPRGG
ncbi:MAG: HEAT repeat domain-containing protein [Gammaproteobacteria bacterium]|nr:HEAT repeat domain-containing protein [Gammaproteobacteria bacterium]